MQTITFITSYLTFYLKGEISGDQKFLNLKIPNTILGLIPLGAKKESMPRQHIASVHTDFRLSFFSLIVGAFLALLGLGFLCSGDIVLGIILAAVGILMVLGAFQTTLIIMTTASEIKTVSFIIFEKSKAELAKNEILALISTHLDDTNIREQTDRTIDASRRNAEHIINAINSK